jgi:hypothetical protein
MNRHRTLAAALLLTTALAACGGDDDNGDSEEGARTPATETQPAAGSTTIALDEFSLAPKSLTVEAGASWSDAGSPFRRSTLRATRAAARRWSSARGFSPYPRC